MTSMFAMSAVKLHNILNIFWTAQIMKINSSNTVLLLLFLQILFLGELHFVSFHGILYRCSICIPAAQPSPQWPRSADAGHQVPSAGARLQEASPPTAPTRWLDQRWWCASWMADEATCCCLGGGCIGPSWHHCCHLPFTYDVCWTYRGEKQCWLTV